MVRGQGNFQSLRLLARHFPSNSTGVGREEGSFGARLHFLSQKLQMAFSDIQGSRDQASSTDRQERSLVNKPHFSRSPNLHSIGVELETDHMWGGGGNVIYVKDF